MYTPDILRCFSRLQIVVLFRGLGGLGVVVHSDLVNFCGCVVCDFFETVLWS